MEEKFNDLNIDAVLGTNMMSSLGLTPKDLEDPHKFEQLRHILSYFKDFPGATRESLIRRITIHHYQDKLRLVWEYTQLAQTYQTLARKLSTKKDLLEKLDATNEDGKSVDLEIKDLKKRAGFIKQEMGLYE